MQVYRLFKIIYILLGKKQVTAKYLANEFEVSIRTIYRDIDALSLLNIPIYTTKGKNGGIHILENFILDKSLISKIDQDDVLTGLKTLNAFNETKNEKTLNKFQNLFQNSAKEWIEIDFSDWTNNNQNKEMFSK